MARRTLRLVAVVSVATGLAVTGGWYLAAALASRALDEWAAAREAEGYDVSWTSTEITGFPLRLDGRIEGARLTRPGAEGASWTWTPPTVGVRFFALRPDRVELDLAGQHLIDLVEAGRVQRAVVAAGGATALLDFAFDGALDGAVAEFSNIEASVEDSPLRVTAAGGALVIDQNPSAAAHAGAEIVRMGARFVGIELPPTLAGPLGRSVDVLLAEVDVVGAIDAAPTARSLASWREDGGAVELRRLEVVWGPVRATADGTVTLDAELQPEADLAARIHGLDNAIAALEETRVIEPRAAAFARLALIALARRPEDGGPPEVRLPITIQDRRLSLGPVALLTLPWIRWP
ncbi:MAG: DUF2125 domain-containing protein [Alphaproteobacteria bacterium]